MLERQPEHGSLVDVQINLFLMKSRSSRCHASGELSFQRNTLTIALEHIEPQYSPRENQGQQETHYETWLSTDQLLFRIQLIPSPLQVSGSLTLRYQSAASCSGHQLPVEASIYLSSIFSLHYLYSRLYRLLSCILWWFWPSTWVNLTYIISYIVLPFSHMLCTLQS